MNRQYQGVQLFKKESELITFLQTGSDNWFKAFYVYKHRKKPGIVTDKRKQRSWFNKTLLRLHIKELMKHIPFIWQGFAWRNPGVEASKANLVIEVQAEHIQELRAPKKIIV